MTQRDVVFELDPRDPAEELVSELRDRFPGRTRAERVQRFDWRLHRATGELTLDAEPEPVLSWSPNHGARPVRQSVASAPVFVRDLPPGRLRRSLERIVDVRRLLPLVELERAACVHDVLDGEQKTVVRVEVRERRVRLPGGPWQPLATTVTVRRFLGYDVEREALVRFLECRAGLPVAETSELEGALSAVGRPPGDGAAEIELAPDARAGEAVRAVLRALVAALRRNEEGVLARLDPEHLHDFRVAVRSTRAVLAELGDVFPEPVREHYREEFLWLGSCTGPSRDLDVLEIELPRYEESLPAEARRALAPLEERVRDLREREQGALVGALTGARYGRLMANWSTLLDQADAPSAERAREPARTAVARATWRRYKRVRRRGRAVGPRGEGPELHRLRIQCKKLRYLLTLFGGLFDPSETKRAAKELKRLQNVLGTVNDLEVHAELVRSVLSDMTEDGRAPVGVARAVGRLEEVLERRGTAARERFGKRFARFESEANRQRFRKLFKKP